MTYGKGVRRCWLHNHVARLGLTVGFRIVASLTQCDQGKLPPIVGVGAQRPMDGGRIPLRLHEGDARECAGDALCDGTHERLDRGADYPLPRHTQDLESTLS